MRFWLALLCVPCFIDTLTLPAAEPTAVPGHQTQTLEGWTLHVSDKLLEQDREAMARALDLTKAQLQEIVKVVPASAVTELRKVPLWFSPEYPKITPRAEYHPNASWLREHQRNPEMAKGVEFTNVRIFAQETKRMPNFVLHELAHAYHDRVLKRGFGNPEVKTAFEAAQKSGLYNRVEQRYGDGRSAEVKAYAMTNPQEYFAECSEAYFSTNDFFPFTREQLERHDPRFCRELKQLWGDAPQAR